MSSEKKPRADVSIRSGTQSDMAAVMSMIQELAVFEKEPEQVETTVDDLIRDGGFTGSAALFHTFVAVVGGEVVGVALYYHRYSTWKGKTLHLEDLVVREAMRGRGIGSSLYARVMREAKAWDVRRVEWVCLDWNKAASDFYESTGATLLNDWLTVQMNSNQLDAYLLSLDDAKAGAVTKAS
jgi:GNAT superfamily N-acetyltransferase